MIGADFFNPGSGGGMWGVDRKLRINDIKFAEHSFEKHDKASGAVTDVYEPGCMALVDLEIIDRTADDAADLQVMRQEAYPVGALPLRRLSELNPHNNLQWKVDPKRKSGVGGYLPSVDNENPALEGPFVVLEGKDNIWKDCPFMHLFQEFRQLGLDEQRDRLAAQGIACLKGTVFVAGSHAMPKSRAALAEEKITGEAKQGRTILVPTQIVQWGWEAGTAAAPAATVSAPATAKPKASAATKPPASAPAAAPTAPAPTTAPSANGSSELDEKLFPVVLAVLTEAGGTLQAIGGDSMSTYILKLMPAINKAGFGGADKVKGMRRAREAEFLTAGENAGLWMFDQASGTVMLVQ